MVHTAPDGPLAAFRQGRADPTTSLSRDGFWRATLTPEGDGTLHLDWSSGDLAARAWGDGAEWLLSRVPAMTGQLDEGHRFDDGHPLLLAAQRRHPHLRIGASGTLYHELLPTVLGQRVTSVEAFRQWRELVMLLGRPAPGPNRDLRLPPDHADLIGRPMWWFHPLGIEHQRARTLIAVARVAHRLDGWVADGSACVADRLLAVPGVGPWTVGNVLATALGDPDAVAVGDYHLRHLVVHAFTGRARGTDDEMLQLLAPYAPQRGRVIRLLQLAGIAAPKFGPRRRIEPINRR